MAITSAIMQMRRGEEEYFDPDKMHPGEWAVSTDTKYVRMCFSPGVCVRMATYEAFEEDMEQIIAILEEAKTVQEAIEKIYEEFQKAELDIEAAENSATLSESYAHGGTGTREGEDTDNAKYYAELAKELKESFEFPVSIENGGTGGTTAKEAQYNLLNDMNVINDPLYDGYYFPMCYVSPTAEKGALYKRTFLSLWEYIKSKAEAIFAKKEDVALNRQTLGYTKKNLLKIDSRSGSYNGITHSSDVEKGTITFNGTFNGSAFFTYNSKFYLKAGTYILSGCPAGGSDGQTNYYRQTVRKVYSDGSGSDNNDYGNGDKITVTQEDVDNGAYFTLVIGILAEFPQNLTFRPMVRSADIIDDTFEPYVDDVDTRLKALTPVNNLLATVPGSPLDAVMGTELNNKVETLITNNVNGKALNDLKICSGVSYCTFLEQKATIELPITFSTAIPIVNILSSTMLENAGVSGNILTVQSREVVDNSKRYVRYIVVGF